MCLLLLNLSTPLAAAGLPTRQLTSLGSERCDRVTARLNNMTLTEKIGQLFIVAPDMAVDELFRSYPIGGVVLFDRHAPDLRQTMELIEAVRLASGAIPPFVAVDQEGGRVARLKFATQVPPARTLASLDSPTLRKIGGLVGEELAALGFNVNFAPVMDVNTDPANPVIGDRAFGDDPASVATKGTAYIAGLRDAGIAGTAKHFPGHGDTRSDSHYQLPVVSQPKERLQTTELAPFRAAIAAGVDLIMTAHVYYPALEPETGQPATLSHAILTGLLRETEGYDRVIITDAMNMKAVTDYLPAGPAAVTAFQAGADIILMPDDLKAAYGALLEAVQRGDIPVSRLNESVTRILTLKCKLMENKNREEPFPSRLSYAESLVGSRAHAAKLQTLLTPP